MTITCAYCGRKRPLVDKKKYCDRCAENMVQECIRCHKPYHSLIFFSVDDNHQRCNSCHAKYEKEKIKNKAKSAINLKTQSEVQDSGSDTSQRTLNGDLAVNKYKESSAHVKIEKRKKSGVKKKKRIIAMNEMSDSEESITDETDIDENVVDGEDTDTILTDSGHEKKSAKDGVNGKNKMRNNTTINKKGLKTIRKNKVVHIISKKKMEEKKKVNKEGELNTLRKTQMNPEENNKVNKAVNFNTFKWSEIKPTGYIPVYFQ